MQTSSVLALFCWVPITSEENYPAERESVLIAFIDTQKVGAWFVIEAYWAEGAWHRSENDEALPERYLEIAWRAVPDRKSINMMLTELPGAAHAR